MLLPNVIRKNPEKLSGEIFLSETLIKKSVVHYKLGKESPPITGDNMEFRINNLFLNASWREIQDNQSIGHNTNAMQHSDRFSVVRGRH